MNDEPFAYGIQAPIGSVTPLFHKLKDAEDYVAKLTDSRDEAKIIPLYRDATLTDEERDALESLISFAEGTGVVQLHDKQLAAARRMLERLGGGR